MIAVQVCVARVFAQQAVKSYFNRATIKQHRLSMFGTMAAAKLLDKKVVSHRPEGTHRMICLKNHARCKCGLRDGVSRLAAKHTCMNCPKGTNPARCKCLYRVVSETLTCTCAELLGKSCKYRSRRRFDCGSAPSSSLPSAQDTTLRSLQSRCFSGARSSFRVTLNGLCCSYPFGPG